MPAQLVRREIEEKLHGLEDYIVLLVVDAKDYQEVTLEVIKYYTEDENMPGIYVTLNKPFETIKNIMKNAGIDTRMIIFIDTITKTAGGAVSKNDECLFIGNPQNLTDLSVAMNDAVNALMSNKKFIFFDSLSTLLIYNQPDIVARFAHMLAGKMRVWKVRGVITSIEAEADSRVISQIGQFCDGIVRINKEGEK